MTKKNDSKSNSEYRVGDENRAFETDMQLAIQLSLDKENNMGSHSETNERNNITTINMPYEPFFISTSEKDIGILIKNIGNVIYDDQKNEGNDDNNCAKNQIDLKTSKICNFNVKAKKN